jgi:hypothetical protein
MVVLGVLLPEEGENSGPDSGDPNRIAKDYALLFG